MAPWVKSLACKSDDLDSIPGTHIKVKGENRLHRLSVGGHLCAHTHTHSSSKYVCPQTYILHTYAIKINKFKYSKSLNCGFL